MTSASWNWCSTRSSSSVPTEGNTCAPTRVTPATRHNGLSKNENTSRTSNSAGRRSKRRRLVPALRHVAGWWRSVPASVLLHSPHHYFVTAAKQPSGLNALRSFFFPHFFLFRHFAQCRAAALLLPQSILTPPG